MEKTLPPTALRPQTQAAYLYKEYFQQLAPDVSFDDIFSPSFWRHHNKGTVAENDIIRLQAHDRSFDIFVTVAKKTPSGLLVEYMGGRPPAGADPRKAEASAIRKAMEIRIVPLASDGKPAVRIEYLPKTKWRLLGLEKREIKRDMPSREEAEKEMGRYLEDMRLRLPTEAELEQMRASKQPA